MSNKCDDALRERFFAKIMPEPNSGCWLWDAAINNKGYGVISKGGGSQRVLYAHRVSMMIHGIELPAGAIVLHKCDTPACVNPEHLRAGSHSENTRDMIERGRNVNTISVAQRRKGNANPRYGFRAEACKHGHRFTPENTRTYDGRQRCLTCRKAGNLSYRKRKSSHANA